MHNWFENGSTKGYTRIWTVLDYIATEGKTMSSRKLRRELKVIREIISQIPSEGSRRTYESLLEQTLSPMKF